LLLIPLFGSRHDKPGPRPARVPADRKARTSLATLRDAACEGTPASRYATRLAVCFPLTIAAVEYADLPHPAWVMTGVATTLRPSWETIADRVIKRMGGQVLGATLTGILLAACASAPPPPLS
jgi:uncharacterized membrane protein YccC